MKFNKLRGRIKEKYGSEKEFAYHLNFTKTKLSRILNNKQSLDLNTMKEFINALDIKKDEINDYFFN